MINGPIIGKLQTMDEVLGELRSLGPVTAAQLAKDWRTHRAVERDLQILVEVVVDVCQRILSLKGHSPAPTSADAVRRCADLGVVASGHGYERMVQFRNLVVYRYEHIDVEILADIVTRRLDDFDRFRAEILSHVRG